MKNKSLPTFPASSFCLLMVFVLSSFGAAAQKSALRLTIDIAQQFQEIEGFGAFNTLMNWKTTPESSKYDLLAKDLGLSILRFELPPGFRPARDSAYDLNSGVFGGPDLQHNFADARELSKRGVKKFIATVWSPPAWMKTPAKPGDTPTTSNGGHLRSDAREDFANYLAAYCKAFRQQTGVELYAVGLQNEPEFAEPYNSCIYTPEEMREALRSVGRRFRKESISTKIYLPEALPAQTHIADFFNAINQDTETRTYADIFAIHNYDRDGINVGGAGSAEWKTFAGLAAATPPAKQLWMTETSGHANNWEGAMLLAANIYNALRNGNISAWVWWALADKKSSEQFALVVDDTPTVKYWVSKQFYHFIRPGARRVECVTSDGDVLPLAFIHSSNYRLVLVLINKAKSSRSVALPRQSGVRELWRSTAAEHCVQHPATSATVVLPASSVTTIVWK